MVCDGVWWCVVVGVIEWEGVGMVGGDEVEASGEHVAGGMMPGVGRFGQC